MRETEHPYADPAAGETDALEPEAWDEAVVEQQTDHGSAPAKRRMSPRRALAIRRGIGVSLMLAMALGIFHVVFRTDLLAPVLVAAGPVQEGIDWVMADPARAWGALAALVIPHIGLYYMIFEDR